MSALKWPRNKEKRLQKYVFGPHTNLGFAIYAPRAHCGLSMSVFIISSSKLRQPIAFFPLCTVQCVLTVPVRYRAPYGYGYLVLCALGLTAAVTVRHHGFVAEPGTVPVLGTVLFAGITHV